MLNYASQALNDVFDILKQFFRELENNSKL